MNTKFLSIAAVAVCVACSFTACDDDDDDNNDNGVVTVASVDYSSDNAKTWGNYMVTVAKLLVDDATTLYNDWDVSFNGGKSYAEYFKSLSGEEAVQEIIQGSADIANEVGESKIGDPVNKWESGLREAAVLAVESWYSWHSRDDYSNNILSVRNSYYGSLDGTVADKSLSNLVKAKDAAVDTKIVNAIDDAYNKIIAIPQPFRNNIASAEAKAAQEACEELRKVIEDDLASVVEKLDEADLKAAVANYVDVVVVPTYKDLKEKATALRDAAKAFADSPSNDGFKLCATAWLAARKPWETSEAFLFGPVADKGLDPNMDSWPLDQVGITNILNSGDFDDLVWDGDFDEDNDDISAAQALRGFHTLEFLIFKDGEARKVN